MAAAGSVAQTGAAFYNYAMDQFRWEEPARRAGRKRRIHAMIRPLIAGTAALALVAGPAMVQQASAQQKTVKIGFISTFSGPAAAIGNDMRNSFELGLDHLGRKIGGLPVEVVYEDDEIKPEVCVQKNQKII